MMACGGVKVYIHTFLTSPLDGDERFSCRQAFYGRRNGVHILVRQNKNRIDTNFVVTSSFRKFLSVHHIMINKNTSLIQLISIYFTYSKSLHISGRTLPIIGRI